VSELLDAQLDAMELLEHERPPDEVIACLDYLRALQRKGHEVLAAESSVCELLWATRV
jgi:hypothetical protein